MVRRSLFLVVMALVLAGCGGGGGATATPTSIPAGNILGYPADVTLEVPADSTPAPVATLEGYP
jgi:ABC-type glycerol-3-phosphate transport system substrate-binding protein